MNQDNVRWLMQDEHRDCLLDRGKLRLSEWLEKGSASVVKQGPHRTVYEVRLPSLHFFLKHNHSTGTKAKLRRLVRKSKGRIEHDCALEVARREVPTFTPLALGESSGSHNSGESYLLTHALKDTHSLSHFLEQDLPTFPESTRTHWRQSIAIELGKLLAKMHNTGILHRDLHPANILIQFIDGKPKLFLIDLDAVQLRSSLDWKSRAANLVILNRWFILRSSRSDRLRFWRAYSGDKTNREGALDIELDTEISNQRFWRSLDPRCIKKNRRFRPLKASGVVGHTVTDMDEKVLADLRANPDAPFED